MGSDETYDYYAITSGLGEDRRCRVKRGENEQNDRIPLTQDRSKWRYTDGLRWDKTPATQSSTQPAKADLKESEPVRVNGVDFQLVAPVVWVVPTDKMEETTIPWKLKVTNQTGKDIEFDVEGAWRITLTDADGKERMWLTKTEGIPQRPVLVVQGHNILLDHTVLFKRMGWEASESYVRALDGTSAWGPVGLKLGQYAISVSYESRDESVWSGKVITKAVQFEITDKRATTQPATAEAAWKAVVAALQAGDKEALAKATTEKGYKSIMGEEGKAMTVEERKLRGDRWSNWEVQFSRKTDDAATANVVAPKTDGGIWVTFIKTAEGWKIDGWTPGE